VKILLPRNFVLKCAKKTCICNTTRHILGLLIELLEKNRIKKKKLGKHLLGVKVTNGLVHPYYAVSQMNDL
jgi:hypothetical protein